MVLHATHNGLLLLMQTFEQQLRNLGIGTGAEQHVPTSWLWGAAAIIAVATGLIVIDARQRHVSATG